MTDSRQHLMVTSNVINLSKNSGTKSAINFFDGTPYSARVPMSHEHLVQTQPRLST